MARSPRRPPKAPSCPAKGKKVKLQSSLPGHAHVDCEPKPPTCAPRPHAGSSDRRPHVHSMSRPTCVARSAIRRSITMRSIFVIGAFIPARGYPGPRRLKERVLRAARRRSSIGRSEASSPLEFNPCRHPPPGRLLVCCQRSSLARQRGQSRNLNRKRSRRGVTVRKVAKRCSRPSLPTAV